MAEIIMPPKDKSVKTQKLLHEYRCEALTEHLGKQCIYIMDTDERREEFVTTFAGDPSFAKEVRACIPAEEIPVVLFRETCAKRYYIWGQRNATFMVAGSRGRKAMGYPIIIRTAQDEKEAFGITIMSPESM